MIVRTVVAHVRDYLCKPLDWLVDWRIGDQARRVVDGLEDRAREWMADNADRD